MKSLNWSDLLRITLGAALVTAYFLWGQVMIEHIIAFTQGLK